MATFLHGESRRMYSWWWDSHISPKNSKWLQENLTDMDMKVKAMIRLLEEDADSFARRAEMYYKKRPELMKLVEEFYRAYRALAERYDHATGALRQAHRTMAEAFPNQVPLMLPDESPSGSSGMEVEPHTPESSPPVCALFEPDDLQRDALGASTHLHITKRNGAYSEESDVLSSKKGLKQLNDLFATGEGALRTNQSEGKVRKGLNFHEEAGKGFEHKSHDSSNDLQKEEVKENEDFSDKIKSLQEEITQLSTENQNLKNQMTSQSEPAEKAETEIKSLKDTLYKLDSEKDNALLQYQQSVERITALEIQFSHTQNDFNKLHDEMLEGVKMLNSAKELNQSLQLELDTLEQKAKLQEQELKQKREELEGIHISLQEELQRRMQAEMAHLSVEKLLTRSQEEVKILGLQIQEWIEKTKSVEDINASLGEEMHKLKVEYGSLKEQNLAYAQKINNLQEEITFLKEIKEKLHDEVGLHVAEKELLQKDLYHLTEDRSDLDQKYQSLVEQVETVRLKAEEEVHKLKEEIGHLSEQNLTYAQKINDLQEEIIFLKETKEKLDDEVGLYVVEKELLQKELYSLTEDRNDLDQKYQDLVEQTKAVRLKAEEEVHKLEGEIGCLNEQNLTYAQMINDLQEEITLLKETKEKLHAEVGLHAAEKELLQKDLYHLSEDRNDLDQKYHGLVEQAEVVRLTVEEELQKLKEEIGCLNEQNLTYAQKINDLQEEITLLKETKEKLYAEVGLHVAEKELLQKELYSLTEDRNDLDQKYQDLEEQMKAVRLKAEEAVHKLEEEIGFLNEQDLTYAQKINDLQEEITVLKETKEKLHDEVRLHVAQKELFQKDLYGLSEDRNDLDQKYHSLVEQAEVVRLKAEEEVHNLKEEIGRLNEQNLTFAQKMNNLQEEIILLKKTKEKLHDEAGLYVAEKELLQKELYSLTEDRNDLDQKYQDLVEQMKAVRLKAEEEVHKRQEENHRLNEQNISSALKINNLQDEIVFLKQAKGKLEDDVVLHVTEKDILEQELYGLKENINDIEQRHHSLMEQMEAVKLNAEEEVCKLKEENGSLYEQNFSSALKIKILQEEILLLKETQGKLEDEVGLHVKEKEILEQELYQLKEERNDLEQKHSALTERMEAVRLSAGSLQESVKELRQGNTEMKEVCKKHEVEKELLLEKLKNMGEILEKNAVLENSLSDANVELEVLRQKISALEESKRSICGEISSNIAEKAALALQVESLAQNVENLSKKNTLLEKSLYDVNTELESLRVKLKGIEESCQSLSDQKTSLLMEKSSLISQVECISQDRESLYSRCTDLEDKLSSLSGEKDFILGQVEEPQGLLRVEKYEREGLVEHHNAQLADLENQIHLLQEENRVLQQEFELEQRKLMDALIETFILQRSVFDMREKSSILSTECQKCVELSRYQEKLISQLEQENCTRKREMTLLVDHYESLRKGIQLLMKALSVSKESASVDEIKEEVFLHTLGEIKDLQNNITNAEDEIQKMHLETSVLITILKQMGLNLAYLSSEKSILKQKLEARTEELLAFQNEKHELLGMNDNLSHDLRASKQREEVLKAELEILHVQLLDLRGAHLTSQVEVGKLLEENQSLSKEFYNLREKQNTLEKENNEILAEAMALEHLYVFFRNHSSERVLDLKLFLGDLECLQLVNNDLNQTIGELNGKMDKLEVENMQLKESVVYMEEFRSCVVILEFELSTTRKFCEELNHQLESLKNLLIHKDLELTDAYQQIQSANERNTELCKEIRVLHETNEMAQEEVEKLRNKVEVHLGREHQLTSELQKSMYEVERCEEDIATLLIDAQVSSVNMTLYEEKIFELIGEGERLEISAIVQRDILNREIALQVACVDELMKRVDYLESENRGLKSNLITYLPLLTSLQGSIASLEEHILSLSMLHASSDHQEQESSSWQMQQISGQDMSLVPLQDSGSCQLRKDHSATVQEGVSVLQKLNAKVEALQNVIIDFRSLLEEERLEARANLEAASKEINGLKKMAVSGQGQVRKESTAQQNKGRVINDESEISRVKYGQTMKDIQLDQVSSPLAYENGAGLYGVKRNEYAAGDDQMLQLWETAERDCNNQAWKASTIVVEHDIETVEEEKSEYPSSELAAAKELSIDKLEIPKRASESREEWSRRVLKMLASDAQRLSVLQTSMEDLKRKMEGSEKGKKPTTLEYDTVKVQLREAEGAILELVDINNKLTKKAEAYSVSSDGMITDPEDTGSAGRKQISERAWRGSEKIGKLELELHKIQYILLKLEEEHQASQTKVVDRKTSVLLREYLYGRRDSRRQKKKRAFCGCMRPRTEGDF